MRNKDIVKAAMTALFVERDLSALDRYWDPGYIQHNPRMPNGVEFFKKMIPSLGPDFMYEAGMVIEEGDLVVAHGRYAGWAGKTMIAVDIFRLRQGKLVEHWDVIQEEVAVAQTISGNPMFP
ncbi:MAG TPA: nuclear transport factor 2 family protein [Candidatus Aquabacterium excrementipullorum]|nr:nuclear transport factor 2 family protein [Candidatus Aquabacterium excrementipullorum]